MLTEASILLRIDGTTGDWNWTSETTVTAAGPAMVAETFTRRGVIVFRDWYNTRWLVY